VHVLVADGVVRARSWVKGQVSIHSNPGDNIAVGRLELDLLGTETSTTIVPHGPFRHCMESLTAPVHISPLSANVQREPHRQQDHIFLAESILLTESTVHPTHGDECILYPFSVFLPASLPPTMEHVDKHDGSYCAISYRLTATASISLIRDADETDSTIRMQTFRASRFLYVIGETLSTVHYPFSTYPSSHPIKQGVLHRGHIIMAVHAVNTHVSKGCCVCFAMAIANKSQCDIEYVEVTLIEKIRHGRPDTEDNWCHGKGKDRRYLKDHSTVLRSYVDWFPEGKYGEHPSGVSPFRFKEVMPTITEFYKIEELMHAERNQIRVQVPPKARTSYSGKLVDVEHCIEIKVAVKDAPIHCHPRLTIPVTVFDRPLKSTCMKHNAMLGTVDIPLNVK
jgi:hypothetical protein